MALTKLYYGCDYSTMTGVTVTMDSGATFTNNITIGNCQYTSVSRYITTSIPAPLSEELRVYYGYYSKRWDSNNAVVYEGTQTLSFPIPAGQTSYTFVLNDTSETICRLVSDSTRYENHITALYDQPSLPTSCTGQPSGCTLNISLGNVVVPSSRGDNDGSVTVSLTGATGGTITYYKNGVDMGIHSPTYTYTGLTSGYYTFLAKAGDCYDQIIGYYLQDGQFSTGTMIQTQPANISAANNPIVLQLETAINSDVPLPSKSNFRVATTVSQDTTITFNLNYPQQYTATFTAKGFPDSNKYFLASQLTDEVGNVIGSNTTSEIATSIAEAFQQDPVISRLYYITNSGTYIYLIAKENNPNLDLNTSRVTVSNTNSIILTQTQGGVSQYDGQLTSDYSIYAEVYVNPALEFGASPVESDFRRVGELQLPFQKDNKHIFQLDTILKNYVTTPKIDFSSTGFTTIPSYDVAYYVKYGEIFPLIANSNTKKKRYKSKTSYRTACNAALNFEDSNDMQSYLGDALSYLNPNFGYSGIYGAVVFNNLVTSTGVTSFKNAVFLHSTNMQGWQNSGYTFSGLPNNTYTVKLSGITNSIPYTIQKQFTYNPSSISSGYGFYGATIPQIPRTNISWLTNSPSPLYIQRNSKQYISFLLERGYANANRTLSVKGDLHFYNGTSITGVTFFNITSGNTTNFGGMTILSCGYNEMGLAAYENSGNTKIRRADFAVWQTDSVLGLLQLTDVKTYLFEIDEAPTKYGTIFLNKLGTWDTFDWVGEIVYDEDVTRETYQVPREILPDGSSPKGFEANSVYNTQYTRRVTVNSGTIDEATYIWLQELLQSNKIYCYTNDHQNFLIVTGYVSNKSTNNAEFTMQVSFSETIFENSVSV